MKNPIALFALTSALALTPTGARAVDDAYPPGEAGRFEIRTLPEARVIEAPATPGGDLNSEAERDALFRKLFRYIDKNDIAMTAPVEMRAGETQGGMMFYLGEEAAGRSDLKPTPEVRIRVIPARTVATMTVRGAYTRARLEETEKTLRERLAAEPGYVAAGEPYAVYWNSPFMPGPFKKSEVHIPVKAVAAETTPAASGDAATAKK